MYAKTFLISFCVLARCALHSVADTTCEDALTEIKSLLLRGRGQRPDESHDIGSACNGRPGTTGALGPPGPPGPPGETGTCTCDLTSITAQLNELKEFQNAVRRSPGMCYVGISTGAIKLTQLSASSVHSTCPFKDAVLNSKGAWCTASNNANQWIQVDFLVARTITGIVTRGRENVDQWVTSYHVSYGDDVAHMRYYAESHEPKVFAGNTDRNTIVENMLSAPITARFFRIHPVTRHGHMSMRIELRQC